MKKDSVIATILIVIAVAIAGYFAFESFQKSKIVEEEISPDAADILNYVDGYSYTNVSGSNVSLDSYEGSLLVVNSWATWSPASVEELRLIGELSGMYTEQEVRFLAINRGDKPNIARSFLKKYDIPDNVHLILDPEDRYYNTIEGFNMPETVVYGSNGLIIEHIRGSIADEKLQGILNRELSK